MRKDKKKAISLRLSGKSYNEISTKLGVPKSTLSSWFRREKWPTDFLKDICSKNKRIWSKNITKYNR